MNVLLTNDDGFDQPGITLLAKALEKEHQVYIVAPDGNRSGFSHGVTLYEPVRLKNKSPRVWSCSGTPSDCVTMGAQGILDFKPDVILSGINYGANLGTDIIYSGTAAAAREGALKGIPSIATSLNQRKPPFDFTQAIEFLVTNLKDLVLLWDREHFININVPSPLSSLDKVKITTPCVRKYVDGYKFYTGPRGDLYAFMDGDIDISHPEKGTDLEAVEEGYISLSPVSLHPENCQNVIEDYHRHWPKE